MAFCTCNIKKCGVLDFANSPRVNANRAVPIRSNLSELRPHFLAGTVCREGTHLPQMNTHYVRRQPWASSWPEE